MFCIENSYRFQIPFPETGHESADTGESLEKQIFSRYLQSVVLRLNVIIQLKSQGKLQPEQAQQEIQLLRSQLQQTQQELGLVG